MLTLKLLGEFSIDLDGERVEPLRSRTAAALLVYLACEQRPFTRDYLAALFWPEHDASAASANLRTTLKLLRKSFAGYLTITRKTLAFNHDADHDIDALTFTRELAQLDDALQQPLSAETAVQLTATLAHYRGDFLQGFHLPNANSFEAWQTMQREHYSRLAQRGLRRLVDYYSQHGRYADGIDHAARLLAFDPLDESTQQKMMEMLWRSGQRNAALQQYETVRRLLADELAVLPTAQTNALYQRIRTAPTRPRHNLPMQANAFVGRTGELQTLAADLANPACRLLTILGPGGVGKTRLLVELGAKIVANFPGQFAHGVRYAALTHLDDGRLLTTAVADAVGATLSGVEEPLIELRNFLREKEMLLLLDNFEHLLEGDDDACLTVLTQILQQAPQVKVVVTSRIRLQLQEEWVFDLDGLPVPPPAWDKEDRAMKMETAVSFAAVQLFIQAARRIRRSFTPDKDNLPAIVNVCRLLHGLPLTIEMAASWSRQLTPPDILQQIETDVDIDFLSLSARNIPDRHRTLRAVFEHSWQLLTAAEATAMRRLSVFRGPISVDAAYKVAGCTAETLAALADKSMLQHQPESGPPIYDMHALLRQFASQHLHHNPTERHHTEAAHAAYYANFLQQRTDALISGGTVATNDVAAAIDEIRAAWTWNFVHDQPENVNVSIEALSTFYWSKGWLQEGLEMATRAAQSAQKRTPPHQPLLNRALMWQADFHAWLGQYEEASTRFEHIIADLRDAPPSPELAFSLGGLGRIHYWQGQYDAAEATFTTCLQIARHLEEGYLIALALSSLANTISASRMDYQRAWELYEESLAISREEGDQFGSARALINMGAVAQEWGQLEKAKQLYAESLEIYRAIPYQHGISAALNYLGQTAYLNGEYDQAGTLIQESYDLNRETGNRRAMADSLKQLGNVAREAGRPQEALQRYGEAMQLAQALASDQLVLSVLLETAVLHQSPHPQKARLLAATIIHHPGTGEELAAAAKEVLTALSADKPAAEWLSLAEAVQLALSPPLQNDPPGAQSRTIEWETQS